MYNNGAYVGYDPGSNWILSQTKTETGNCTLVFKKDGNSYTESEAKSSYDSSINKWTGKKDLWLNAAKYIDDTLTAGQAIKNSIGITKAGFNVFLKNGAAIIKGARGTFAKSLGILGTRYTKDVTVMKYVKPALGAKEALKGMGVVGGALVALDVGIGIYENIKNNTPADKIFTDAVIDTGFGVGSIAAVGAISALAVSTTGAPVAVAGLLAVGVVIGANVLLEKTGVKDWIKDKTVEGFRAVVDTGRKAVDGVKSFFKKLF